jgi:hypothetical protein
MAYMTLSLPWWYPLLKSIENLPAINSGCNLIKGNIACVAENMRKFAEAKFKALGIANRFSLDDSVSMDEYSLARYVATEVGSGTPSDKVAVVEAARNRAKLAKISVDQLLRLRQPVGHPSRGFYGPIHATEEDCKALGLQKGCAPYKRWAGTKRDPEPIDIIVAKLVMSGRTNDFARGADDQLGPSAGESLFGYDWIDKRIRSLANDNDYWVGLLPGVNHRKTMLFKYSPEIHPQSVNGQKLIQNALDWAHKTSPNWETLPVDTKVPMKPTTKRWIAAGTGVLGIGAAFLALRKKPQKRFSVPVAAAPSAKYVLYASNDCPACQDFKPLLKASTLVGEVHEISLDTDEGMEAAQAAGIRVLPTVVRVSDGKKFAGIDDPKRLLR